MCECLARALRSWVSVSHASNSACVQVRWGSTSRRTRLTCGRVSRGIFFPPLLLHGQQEGASEQGQGEVMVPAGPTPHLVFVQAGFAFGRLEFGLDGPAGGRDLGQRQQRGLLGGVGEVVARLAAVEIMPQQQPAGAAGQALAALPHAERDELVGPQPLRPLGHGQVLPGARREASGDGFDRAGRGSAYNCIQSVSSAWSTAA